MLAPKAQSNLKNAKAYFREHLSAGDYYAEGRQVPGYWFGVGAEKLGLNGRVSEREFLRLCEGEHPKTGARLTARHNTHRRQDGTSIANRRVFYDFTFSPPKSVSVVALLHDPRIVALHDQAVAAAMRELERYAETRVRRHGNDSERSTGCLVGASFQHDTSREKDPHLHTHCVLLNATFDPVEHRWKALQAAGMYRAQKLAEGVYYHELCRGLTKLGYAIEPNRRDFELKGVPVSVIERFSKRHRQIDAEATRQTRTGKAKGNVKDVREQVARASRQRKSGPTTAELLRSAWWRELDKHEASAVRSLAPAVAARRGKVNANELLAWADAHLFERRAVVTDHELLATALARGRGGEFDVSDLRAALQNRTYVREAGSRRLTSPGVLRAELAVVLAARDGRGAHAPLSGQFRPDRRLSGEQERAVRRILGSRDFIALFRGGAGTGKSFALKEVHGALVAVGRPVVVVAPQRQQVEDLGTDGLPGQTLARLLNSGPLPRGAVVLVDEAGQVGARDLQGLIALVKASGGRIILSGDTRQHGAVAASDALRAIEAYGGVVAAEIETIRRQDPARGRTAAEKTAIARYRSAVKAAAAGEIAASFGILDRLGSIREVSAADRHAVLAEEYLNAVNRRETPLVVGQTWSEVNAVNDAVRAALRRAGKLAEGTMVESFQAVDATDAQKRDPASYRPGDAVFFQQRYGRFCRGDQCMVHAVSDRGLVLVKNGRRSTVGFAHANRLVVGRRRELAIAAGDRLQLKFNGRSVEGVSLLNGELVTVQSVRRTGEISVVDAQGRRKTLSASQRLLNRGYAVTSYASQGKTVDTVLFSDAQNRAATNANQWYVTISRGRKRVLIFTPDKGALVEAIERTAGRDMAIEIEPKVATTAQRKHVRRDPVREVIETLRRIRCLAMYRRTRQPGIRPRL